jgi:hypothetical protein
MSDNPNFTRLQELITWTFTVSGQTMVARYGRLGPDYYKQYLPAGLPVPERHPPRRISKLMYELALRQYERQTEIK